MRRTKNHLCTRVVLLILITSTSITLTNPWVAFIHPTQARAHASTFQFTSGTDITYIDPANVTNLTLTPESPLTLRPDGDGTYTDWTGSYADWDEAGPHDGDTSYVSTNAAYQYESSTLENHTSETWSIAKVKVTVYAKTNIISDDKVTPFLVVGGWQYMGAGHLLTNETYTECTSEWAKNPDTGSYWSWSDIDALEAGASADVGDDWIWDAGLEMRVTQLYVEVTGPRLAVDIKVDDVADLWLYQFELTYNPDVLQGVWLNPLAPVEIGPFLTSAGGTKLENPGAGWNNTLGKLPITGGYLSETDPAKCPDGGPGILSTVFFEVIALGDSDLRLEELTGLQDPEGGWIAKGRDYVADGYFRNVAWGDMPQVDFTITPVDTPEPLEGYNTTFTSTTTGGTAPYTYKWYLWKIRRAELFWPIVTTDTVTRNYTTRGYWNVTLTVIDDNDVVGTKTGYVRIKAHDIFFTAVTTNATRGEWPSGLFADMGDIVEINATAINQGDYTETFDVSTFWAAFYGGEMHLGLIGTETDITLAPGASQNVTFNWDTEGLNLTHPGQFAIHANASAVTYEYDREMAAGKIADNEFFGPLPFRIRFRDVAVTDVDVYNYLLIRPAGDGTYMNMTGAYTDWDDWPPEHDADLTYVSADAKDLYGSSILQDHTMETWSIDKVTVTVVARSFSTPAEELQLMLVVGGTLYESITEYSLETTYSKYSSEWTQNPATGSAWTWLDIDALEAGVKSTQRGTAWTGEIRVTQLYVEVFGPGESVVPGEIVGVSVTVKNEGDFNATAVSVTAYFNETAIDTQTIPLLTNASFGLPPRFPTVNHTATLIFNWNTTDAALGDYVISAEVSVVPGEIYVTDNVMVDGVADVIPEVPVFLILPLFMVATLLAVIVHRRRRST